MKSSWTPEKEDPSGLFTYIQKEGSYRPCLDPLSSIYRSHLFNCELQESRSLGMISSHREVKKKAGGSNAQLPEEDGPVSVAPPGPIRGTHR